MQREPVGVRIVWIVNRPEFNARVYARGNEDTLTEKTVGLGDYQPGLVFPAGGKGALQPKPDFRCRSVETLPSAVGALQRQNLVARFAVHGG